MRIQFTPQRRDDALVLEKTSGDRLRINGELFNFNPVPEGGSIPAGEVPCQWLAGSVERIDGEIRITLILPHGANPSQAVASPEPIVVNEDGPIAIPHDNAEEVVHVDA